ncbi:hypothetical protein [Aliarcobacter skirrowii]|uniref:hypothetical protein n=1 Tax=Aliarcobacter skirrowii TaxID=28200 RepID=UPI000D60C840|nr:hypothetical protein [Aliarcobacter skirrowii]PWE20338.1 hypothetical protein DGF29_06785 [Aliarcobacter skirrowii]PWE24685.1 hypothetical protein DGE88_09425 [Aliarcobacter skirrowii]RJO55669.1 hypothetical protein DIR39_06790 [Aliarcobacter skirrowii]RJO57625.1 hypothetical protein DIR38_06790 [Aliarcobacter skirrowii]
MADSHVISALSTKRGEILGSIKHYKQIISSLDKDLTNIDATIKIFEPDYKFGSEKIVNKHRNRFFNNGEAKVLVLEVLKSNKLPLSTDKLSEIIATNKNLSFENKTDKSNFQKSILLALNNCLSNNLVEKVSKDGLSIIWKIKEI